MLLSLAHATVLSCLKYSNNFLTASPCKQILFQFFALPVSFITEELAWPAKHESWWSLMKPQPANTYQWFHKACALNSKVLFFWLRRPCIVCVCLYFFFCCLFLSSLPTLLYLHWSSWFLNFSHTHSPQGFDSADALSALDCLHWDICNFCSLYFGLVPIYRLAFQRCGGIQNAIFPMFTSYNCTPILFPCSLLYFY